MPKETIICPTCGGSGSCNSCSGRGYFETQDGIMPCANCGASGQCSICAGAGKVSK